MKRNKLSEHKTLREKEVAYRGDCIKGARLAMAYSSNGTTVPLVDVDISNVEFIGGLWRVQDKFPHKIQYVRGEPFVLQGRLARTERNHFEFYRAARVGYNCYGPYIVSNSPLVVAKYATDCQTYWAYGATVEQARAFLGIKLYDEYMDLIHAVACKNCNADRQK